MFILYLLVPDDYSIGSLIGKNGKRVNFEERITINIMLVLVGPGLSGLSTLFSANTSER